MFRTSNGIFNKYINVKRYRKVIGVLIKHGFGDFVEHSNLVKSLPFFGRRLIAAEARRQAGRLVRHSRWTRVRFVLEELGPAFVKLGQFLSNRPDILPMELCKELAELFDEVTPFDGREARRVVERELNAPVDDVFSYFSPDPVSSASIAQVHRGRLRNGGAEVAVKVRRPGIQRAIESDLEIMRHIAKLMERFVEGVRALDPLEIVDEFARGIKEEIDFTNEAANIEKFRVLFQRDKRVHVPEVHRDYLTAQLLVMEYVEGVKLSALMSEDNDRYDREAIANNLADLILDQIFEHGFFHADPHPGNIIVLGDSILCFIDFGLMGSLPPRHKALMSSIMIGLVRRDPRRIASAAAKLSERHQIEDKDRFETQIFRLIDHHTSLPLKDVSIGDFFNDLIRIVVDNHLKIPSDLYLMIKALASAEGVTRKLNPDANLIKRVEPSIRRLINESMSPRKLFQDFADTASEYADLLQELPDEIREIIGQFKTRSVKIQFEHKGLEPMLQKHDAICNRIAFSIITASLIIGSSLILHAGIAPIWHGVSLFGVWIFIFSGVLGFLLLIAILRHGRF